MSKYHYLIIGNSRTAKHFSYYFSSMDISYTRWQRSKNSLDELKELLASNEITHVLVLIPDRFIESFYLEHLQGSNKVCVHFSGSLVILGMHGLHPLNTFTLNLYNLDEYKSIVFVSEQGNLSFNEVFPKLPNESYAINPELKPFYHALCVISGNFTSIIWNKMFTELEMTFNIPREAAFPYLKKIVSNVMLDSEKALTGPLARKDYITINKNLVSLQQDPFYNVYKSFVKLYESK